MAMTGVTMRRHSDAPCDDAPSHANERMDKSRARLITDNIADGRSELCGSDCVCVRLILHDHPTNLAPSVACVVSLLEG